MPRIGLLDAQPTDRYTALKWIWIEISFIVDSWVRVKISSPDPNVYQHAQHRAPLTAPLLRFFYLGIAVFGFLPLSSFTLRLLTWYIFSCAVPLAFSAISHFLAWIKTTAIKWSAKFRTRLRDERNAVCFYTKSRTEILLAGSHSISASLQMNNCKQFFIFTRADADAEAWRLRSSHCLGWSVACPNPIKNRRDRHVLMRELLQCIT